MASSIASSVEREGWTHECPTALAGSYRGVLLLGNPFWEGYMSEYLIGNLNTGLDVLEFQARVSLGRD